MKIPSSVHLWYKLNIKVTIWAQFKNFSLSPNKVSWTARRSNQSILKEIGPEYSLEGLMLKLKLPILWPPDAKSWLIWKDPDAGKDWRWEEKGMTEYEMVGWHHWLNGHESLSHVWLCSPIDCSPPSSSVHGIFQARMLEGVAIFSSGGSFWPRDRTCVSYIGRWILYH